jgi:antitoxin CcdA
MNHAHLRSATTRRKPVNLSLSQDLVDAAKSAGINISAVAETALATAVQDAKLAAWATENKAGLDALNKFIINEGLPLAHRRLF